MTVFSGIPFSDDNPYNYPEAKRLLKLAIDELRARKDLVRMLDMNPQSVGRGAITGRDGVNRLSTQILTAAFKENLSCN